MKTNNFLKWFIGFWVFLITFCIAIIARGATPEITSGYTFQNGEKNVTADKLNKMVGNATINTYFFTGKNPKVIPSGNDWILIYDSSGGIQKATLNSLVFTNVNMIPGRSMTTNMQTSDLFLMWNGSEYVKVPYGWLVLTNRDLVANRVVSTNPAADMVFLGWDGSSNVTSYRSNMFKGMEQTFIVTNLPATTQWYLTNLFWFYNQDQKANLSITPSNFINWIEVATTAVTNDWFFSFTTNGDIKRVPLNVMLDTISPLIPLPVSALFTNDVAPFTNSIGVFTNYPASKLSVKTSLLCTSNNAGFKTGDIVSAELFYAGGTGSPFAFAVNGSNYMLRSIIGVPVSPLGIPMTVGLWKVITRITYYP